MDASVTAIRRLRLRALLGVLAACAMLMLASASASASPQWNLTVSTNSNAAPGGKVKYYSQMTNIGSTTADGTSGDPIVFSVSLPSDVSAEKVEISLPGFGTFDVAMLGWACTGDGPGGPPGIAGAHNVTCVVNDRIPAHSAVLELAFGAPAQPIVTADVAGDASGSAEAQFSLSGGGAPAVESAEVTRISAGEPPFGIDSFDGSVTADAAGTASTQAGAHPYAASTTVDFNTTTNPDPQLGPLWPVAPPRRLEVDLPPGLVGNPMIGSRCPADLLVQDLSCPPNSQVGTTVVRMGPGGGSIVIGPLPVYNIEPPPGSPARFGVNVFGNVVTLDAKLRSGSDYGLTIRASAITQALAFTGTDFTFWGAPAADAHTPERACVGLDPPQYIPSNPTETCAYGGAEVAFLRNPTSCTAPGEGLRTSLRVDSWKEPGNIATASYVSHDPPGYPRHPSNWGETKGIDGCDAVPVNGTLTAQPTTLDAESSSGLVVRVKVPNDRFANPDGIESSDLKKVKVSLPQGVTINPSQAEGLGVCSPAQYESSELSFHPDGTKGCPSNSKIGTVELTTPLLEETIPGSVYIASPYDNPFNSLLAIYIVLEEPQRGILITLPGKVETDEQSGRIVTTFDDLPQLPFDTLDFRFREGARAPLVTPPTCGAYTTDTEFTGHSDPNGTPVKSTSSFQITRGIGGGPCPAGGTPGFDPGFSAGALNNNAGSYSPFVMRLTRSDGEQNLTKFNSVLPPGVSARIAGVEKCSDGAIAAAASRSGRDELAAPSCPANSSIGHTLVGAGVGSVLTYVPGSLYLAGPYNGAPLSVVAITPAVAGPFDVGTVVVRQALSLHPRTAVVSVDGAASDPIPHILKGIPLKLRDIRVYVDRDSFTINPTSCDPSQVGATLFGSAADVFNPADDLPVDRASRFQAASCLDLGFRPKLKINLKGGTQRGAFPGLRAVLTPRPGNSNLEQAAVVLPRSAFLEQAHIRTICTRVQYEAGAGHGSECPKGSQYGYARVWSPLLDQPLQGPVYLRSSDNQLPDMVLALRGIVDIEAVGRIDSVRLAKGAAGIRTVFQSVPDAPLSRVVLNMQGGKKGLIVNSRNLCAGKNRARANLLGHNGRRSNTRPVVQALGCKKQRRAG